MGCEGVFMAKRACEREEGHGTVVQIPDPSATRIAQGARLACNIGSSISSLSS